MIENLAKIVINDYGGDIVPLFINNDEISGTGLCNPSIFIDDKIRLILRHVEYSLYHSESGKHQSEFQGSLSYYHRDDVNELKTNNYYCELDKNTLEIKSHHKIDTSELDVEPMWEFIGLEDARIMYWLNKYYLCGVRRDTTTNGQGRMELSEIEINDNHVKEVSRNRIEVEDVNSYCEKNWMPILSKPFHFIKWTNPTEVVKVNLDTCKAECIYKGDKINSLYRDIRGGTQLIDWFDNTYLCITHETDFVLEDINGYKNVDYYHRFIIFNEDFTIRYISDYFNFMCARVEFCIGLAEYNDDILITFGFQDNGSYLLKLSKESLKEILEIKIQDKNINLENIAKFEGVTYRTAENWFSIVPKVNYENKAINYLEIGTFYGANLLSVANTYCSHTNSKLFCIDPWIDYDDYPEYKNTQENTYKTFLNNVKKSGYKDKIIINRGYSRDILNELDDEMFDIIYIDGNHEPEYVMEDAVLSFRKLKKGGILIFDDYGWGGPHLTIRGIDGFISGYHKKIKVLNINHNGQSFLEKINIHN